MGNEIADKAAQVALNHDLPQFLAMRQRMQDYADRSYKAWEKIYHSLYIVGTKFADHFRSLPEDTSPNALPSQEASTPLLKINVHTLSQDHGAMILKGCVWGATYMAALYSFLKQLDWSAQDHTQRYGLNCDKLQDAYGVATPVPLEFGLWQSPSVLWE